MSSTATPDMSVSTPIFTVLSAALDGVADQQHGKQQRIHGQFHCFPQTSYAVPRDLSGSKMRHHVAREARQPVRRSAAGTLGMDGIRMTWL